MFNVEGSRPVHFRYGTRNRFREKLSVHATFRFFLFAGAYKNVWTDNEKLSKRSQDEVQFGRDHQLEIIAIFIDQILSIEFC